LPSPDSGLSQSTAFPWAEPVAQADIAMGTGNGVAVLPPSCIDVTMMGHAANNK